jgi:hypothetical protein
VVCAYVCAYVCPRPVKDDPKTIPFCFRWRDSTEISYSEWPCEFCKEVIRRRRTAAVEAVGARKAAEGLLHLLLNPNGKEKGGEGNEMKKRKSSWGGNKKKRKKMAKRQKPLCTRWPDLKFH